MTSTLNKLVSRYNSVSLIVRIVIGMIIGLILALLCPGAQWISLFGDLFVGALKAIAPILVFVLVSSALVQGQEKLDSRFALVLILYLVSTLLASVVAVIGSFMFPQTLVLNVAAAEGRKGTACLHGRQKRQVTRKLLRAYHYSNYTRLYNDSK